jgi:cytochrome P450
VARCSVDYGLCSAVLRSPDFGSAVPAAGRLPLPVRLAVRVAGRPSLSAAEAPSMLVADPPEHTRYRRLVTRAFSARAVAALRTRTEEIAEELLDAMAARGPQVDLVRGYAALLPLTVIAEVLGAPRVMREQFLRWGADGVPLVDFGIGYREFRRGELAVDALHAWMLQHFEALRRDPGENILSALVAARDESGALSDDELSSMAMLLLEAGFETTVNLIGNGVALLTRHPDQLEVLRCAPDVGRERWTRCCASTHRSSARPD